MIFFVFCFLQRSHFTESTQYRPFHYTTGLFFFQAFCINFTPNPSKKEKALKAQLPCQALPKAKLQFISKQKAASRLLFYAAIAFSFTCSIQKTPFRLLMDLRMKKAYEMLLEKRPIKEIASSVGYSDIYQFSRAYKRYFGYAPTEKYAK